jgi:hypothetical protein
MHDCSAATFAATCHIKKIIELRPSKNVNNNMPVFICLPGLYLPN